MGSSSRMAGQMPELFRALEDSLEEARRAAQTGVNACSKRDVTIDQMQHERELVSKTIEVGFAAFEAII